MNRIHLVAALVASLGLCTLANAATQTWDFSGANVVLSSGPVTYSSTPGGIQIFAYGFLGTPTAKGAGTALFAKNAGSSEMGLGTNLGSSNEIDSSHFVELDLHNLIGLSVNLGIDSLQGPDMYDVFSSNGLNGTFALIPPANRTATSFGPLSITSANDFLAVSATAADVLISGASTTSGGGSPTPEPRFYGLLLAGLLGVAGTIYRKRQTTA
jgi:hypothetical protein